MSGSRCAASGCGYPDRPHSEYCPNRLRGIAGDACRHDPRLVEHGARKIEADGGESHQEAKALLNKLRQPPIGSVPTSEMGSHSELQQRPRLCSEFEGYRNRFASRRTPDWHQRMVTTGTGGGGRYGDAANPIAARPAGPDSIRRRNQCLVSFPILGHRHW